MIVLSKFVHSTVAFAPEVSSVAYGPLVNSSLDSWKQISNIFHKQKLYFFDHANYKNSYMAVDIHKSRFALKSQG